MNLIIGLVLMLVGQVCIWFQTNGQFVWPWFKNNPLLVSILGGTILSYIFIMATKYLVLHFDGLLWPPRLISFGVGIMAFTALTYIVMGESITLKTIISLILACILVSIQVFWK